jgi:hypothetical protein
MPIRTVGTIGIGLLRSFIIAPVSKNWDFSQRSLLQRMNEFSILLKQSFSHFVANMQSCFNARPWLVPVLSLFSLLALQACTGGPTAPARSAAPAGAPVATSAATTGPKTIALPAGLFDKKQLPVAPAATVAKPAAPVATPPAISAPVVLYASDSTQSYFGKTGVDGKVNIRVWETFLRKYKIPFQTISTADQLDRAQSRVMVLPSAIVLTDREKQAVAAFRAKGGSILSTWLSGVRNESGDWGGFSFMETTLDVKVVGNTEKDADDNFMIVHGDSPITHHVLAGQRVWFDRIKDFFPLRLAGKNTAANIMDWSRKYSLDKPSSVITFDERRQSSGKWSRSVAFGYAEPLWLASDPKLLEAIAHNAITWLLRQPSAYTSAWPYPYSSGFVMAVEAAEIASDVDLDFAKQLEGLGARGSYFILSENAAKSADVLKKLAARGHELAYFGDKYEGFKDQPAATQAKRFDAMRSDVKAAGIPVAIDAGFSAPTDSYDKTTEKLLREGPFGHYIAFMDATDTRLPMIVRAEQPGGKSTVILPRTQIGPEQAIEDDDPDLGLQTYMEELNLSLQMGGLSVIRIPNQTLLSKEQLAKVFDQLKSKRDKTWMSTSGKVAEWWREKSRVSARLESHTRGPLLIVTVTGAGPLKQPATVLVNLPETGGSMKLEPADADEETPNVVKVDAWRTAVIIDGLTPGEYCWYVQFDSSPLVSQK